MKITTKAISALMLMISNRFQVVNQGTDNIPKITEKGIATLDEPQLKPDMVGEYYKKGVHAKTLEEFTQALSGEYDVTCNEAAKKAFPKGITILVGEGHTDEAKKTFAHSPDEEHGMVFFETTKGPYAELCMHEEYKRFKTLVCEGIDTDPARDELVNLLIETQKAGIAAVELFSPHRLKECKPEESTDIWKVIQRCHDVLTEEMPSVIPNVSTQEQLQQMIDAYKKFDDLALSYYNEIFTPKGIPKMQKREKAMAKNLVEHIKRRDEKYPNTTIWSYLGKLHTANVFTQANQLTKGKTPICRVDIKDKILFKGNKPKRPAL